MLTSRFVAPLEVAPHVAGAAVDLTLVDATGEELDLGTPIDATPEQSDGRCYFAADGIGADARAHRDLLARVLTSVGLVNYPTEWWHWSYGDRYWALVTGAPHALVRPGVDGGGGVSARGDVLAELAGDGGGRVDVQVELGDRYLPERRGIGPGAIDHADRQPSG